MRYRWPRLVTPNNPDTSVLHSKLASMPPAAYRAPGRNTLDDDYYAAMLDVERAWIRRGRAQQLIRH